jgi:hypothetical protein
MYLLSPNALINVEHGDKSPENHSLVPNPPLSKQGILEVVNRAIANTETLDVSHMQ